MEANQSTITTASSPIYIGKLPSSPIGPIWVGVSHLGLVSLQWDLSQAEVIRHLQHHHGAAVILDELRTSLALREISEYLEGRRRQFDLPLDLACLSSFQQQALRLTLGIPYGQTSTYQEIAIRMGRPNAARAVGRSEATNPIPLVIPCHRVLGSDGHLHGYGGPGGIRLKQWLLNLEKQHLK
jgi:O-6-methylguanine DNA methyltransferase